MPARTDTKWLADLAWMLEEVRLRKLKDVSEQHLRDFWLLAGMDKGLAVRAISDIARGRDNRELRRVIDERARRYD